MAAAAFNELTDIAKEQMPLWDGEEEIDMLTLFFNASKELPANSMRTLVANSGQRAAVDGRRGEDAGFGVRHRHHRDELFVDPTISTLTSGTLSQNVDLGAMSFPRYIYIDSN